MSHFVLLVHDDDYDSSDNDGYKLLGPFSDHDVAELVRLQYRNRFEAYIVQAFSPVLNIWLANPEKTLLKCVPIEQAIELVREQNWSSVPAPKFV